MTIPDWHNQSFCCVNDGNYNKEDITTPFPGYVLNEKYPFSFVNASKELLNGREYLNSEEYSDYRKNCKTQPSDWKYRKKEVKYTVNSSGYRTYEWHDIDWKESIVILGCSCTFGVGISDEETIAHKLEKLTGRQVVNLGVPAGSNSLILNNVSQLLKKFKMPWSVIINWTTLDRFRFYYESGYHDAGPWDYLNKTIFSHDKNRVDVSKLWNLSVKNETNLAINSYYLSLYADAMLDNYTNYIKVSFFEDTAHFTRSHKWFEIDNEARDLIHPGEKNSEQVANYIHKRIRDNL